MLDIESIFEDEARSVTHVRIETGEALITAGEPVGGMYLVEDGTLEVTISAGKRVLGVGSLGPGDIAGEISLLAGGVPAATVTATSPVTAKRVPTERARAWLGERGEAADALAVHAKERVNRNQLLLLFSELTGSDDPAVLDAAVDLLEIVDVPAGATVYTEGDPGDAAYVVVSGRLIIGIEGPEGLTEITRVGRGQIFGETALFELRDRKSTAITVRDSTLASITQADFQQLLTLHPGSMLRLSRQIVQRMTIPVERQRRATSAVGLAVTSHTNARVLATRVMDALTPFGTVGHLTSGRTDADCGMPGIAASAPGSIGAQRLAQYLHDFELTHDLMVAEVAKTDGEHWARRAFGVADRVVIAISPEPDEAERARIAELLAVVPGPTTTIAVVQHPHDTERPHGSAALRDELGFDEILHMREGSVGDTGRIARLAAGRAVGLVLGGGGARGFAHIGAFRALTEAGIPIDMVAGSSIGAPLAGGIGLGYDADRLQTAAQGLFANLLDYTVPVVSLIKAERITKSIEEAFAGYDFEDTWIPFRCVSTNLTRSRTDTHRSGPVAPRVRASVAIPGVMPPVPDGDDLLVDGGVLNNLPVDVVAEEGRCDTIIAVDVAPAIGPRAKADYGLSVSGWEALRATMGRGRSSFPGITAILMRSMLVGSMRDRNRLITEAPVDLHLELDLRGVGLLDFDNLPPVAEKGYEAAKPLIAEWIETRGGWQ